MNVQTPNESGSGETKTEGTQKAVSEVPKEVIEGQPAPTKAGLYLAYLASAIALVVLGVPPYTLEKQVVVLIFAGMFLAIAATLTIYYGKQTDEYLPKPGLHKDCYKREIETIKISPSIVKTICKILDSARKTALENLKSVDPNLDLENIRANVFLPYELKA